MPNPMSSLFKKELFANQTGEVLVHLLEFNHDTLDDPIRVCDDNVEIVSNGDTYQPWQFEVIHPKEEPGGIPLGSLSIDTVDQSIYQMFADALSSSLPVSVTVSMVMASQPDTLLKAARTYLMFDVEGDDYQANCVLSSKVSGDQPLQTITYNPGDFPGLFEDF